MPYMSFCPQKEKDFSGILKITPAHDAVDFEIARECNLLGPSVSCIGKDGRIIGVPQYDGMDRFEARLKVCLVDTFSCTISSI